jgi:hypothetical protein
MPCWTGNCISFRAASSRRDRKQNHYSRETRKQLCDSVGRVSITRILVRGTTSLLLLKNERSFNPSFWKDTIFHTHAPTVFILLGITYIYKAWLSIHAPMILSWCPSLSAHESESMLRTDLVCREKQEKERDRQKQANGTWEKHTVD